MSVYVRILQETIFIFLTKLSQSKIMILLHLSLKILVSDVLFATLFPTKINSFNEINEINY